MPLICDRTKDDASRILSQQSDFINEIFIMLKEKCKSSPLNSLLFHIRISAPIVVVAALKILAVVARKGQSRHRWKSVCSDISCSGNIPKNIECGELVKRLKTLIKRRDFFVTPAAVAALCEFCRKSPGTHPSHSYDQMLMFFRK